MKIAKIEWRLRAVTRYLLTRYEEAEQVEGSSLHYGTAVQSHGEYDSLEHAVRVGLALTSMDGKDFPNIPVSFDDINVPAPKVRAKMKCVSAWPSIDADGKPTGGAMVSLYAVYEEGAADGANAALENRMFSKATPNASVQMQINNPEAVARFKVGDVFYVDFIPVPKPGELQPIGD